MFLSLLVVVGLLVIMVHEVHLEESARRDGGASRGTLRSVSLVHSSEGARKESAAELQDDNKIISLDWRPPNGDVSDRGFDLSRIENITTDPEAAKKTYNKEAENGHVLHGISTPAPTKHWELMQLREDLAEFAMRKKEPRIEILPAFLGGKRKSELKQDKLVLLHNEEVKPLRRDRTRKSSDIVGKTRALVEAEEALKKHPLYGSLYPVPGLSADAEVGGNVNIKAMTPASLIDTMVDLYNSPQCKNSPVYLTMASVGDELYWQLIENFIYSLVKFEVVSCGLVICVSDPHCMELCQDSHFPCFNYRESTSPIPSIMEQIGILKLAHVPQALAKGVDLFMLDLDVGFLNDPRHMTKVFYETPTIDIFVQMDYLFIMNRSTAGWKQWFTEPLPNIGLFLCRGNHKTKRVFDHAWRKYSAMTDVSVKKNPGKDQNHVLDGMRIGRGTYGLRFAYFKNSTATLLDKIVQKWRGVELGGKPVADFLEQQKTIAVHTTCYEQRTKVMGLKAVNAFWNPRYYDPQRLTLTKQLLYISEAQVLEEARSMVWLAMATKRSFIAPNLYGSPEHISTTRISHLGQAMWPGYRVSYLKRQKGVKRFASGKSETMLKNMLDVELLEPAYYWRVERDYDDVPAPKVVPFFQKDSLLDIRDRILALDTTNGENTRVILQYRIKEESSSSLFGSGQADSFEKATARTVAWAQDSVGLYQDSFEVELRRYGVLPSVKRIRKATGVSDVLNGMRTCKDVFARLRGNRTCFQVCD